MMTSDPNLSAEFAAAAPLLDEISAAAAREADAVFTPERLARQQSKILQRLEQDGRPARVISFPHHGQDPFALRPRPASRWIAIAAAAGLVVGLLAGHLAHDMPGRALAPAVAGVGPTDAPPSTLHAVATTFSEDEFLGQIELAADNVGGSSLRSLHDATPRAWEVK